MTTAHSIQHNVGGGGGVCVCVASVRWCAFMTSCSYGGGIAEFNFEVECNCNWHNDQMTVLDDK